MNDPLPNVVRANRLLSAAWKRGLLTEPKLEAGVIEAAALRGRDTTVFGGDRAWREPFERLVNALREEADLNPLGRTMAYSQLVSLLRGRIRAARFWQQGGGRIGTDDICPPPVIILGQMRSGTTRMQRLLALDERLSFTRAHETLTPVPMPGRRLRAWAILSALRILNPDTLRIHPTSVNAPEEEFGWLSFGFCAAQFEAQWRIPSFSRWWEEADTRALYREFRAIMHLNMTARRAGAAKPWIMKAPQYLQDLPSLLDVFPGARLVRVDRDPAKVAASSASLVWNQMRVQSDSVDKAWIGSEWARKIGLRQSRMAEALAARPDVAVVDVSYEAMERDPIGEMRRVYTMLDLDLDPRLAARMEEWLGASRDHLGHRYRPEDFGLNTSDMAAAR